MLAYHLGWEAGPAELAPSEAAMGSYAPTGKRIRPLLCLLCAAAAGGDWRQALPLGAALELIHNFSLIHDDIQDNSPLRRAPANGLAAVGPGAGHQCGRRHVYAGTPGAAAAAGRGRAGRAGHARLAELNYTCLELTQGQHLDMNFEQRAVVSVPEYLAMIEKKTAVLIAASTFLGASLATEAQARLDHFYAYGWNLGLAYQLQDDLLGIWGDPALTGKSAASDLEQRKKSLPVVYGLEHSAEFAGAMPSRTGPAGRWRHWPTNWSSLARAITSSSAWRSAPPAPSKSSSAARARGRPRLACGSSRSSCCTAPNSARPR